MKNLLTMLAVTLLAVTTHAGAIGWSVDTSSLGGSPNPYAGYIAYLVDANDLEALLASDGKLDKDAWSTSLTLSNATISNKGLITKDVGSYAEGAVVEVYTILFKAGSVEKGVTEYAISSPISNKFGASGNAAYSFPTSSFGTWQKWSDVPEPTTMALLGLGVAALGLRRRRK